MTLFHSTSDSLCRQTSGGALIRFVGLLKHGVKADGADHYANLSRTTSNMAHQICRVRRAEMSNHKTHAK